MLLFKRIFNFEKSTIAGMSEQRLNQRYTPGESFPLQASLQFEGRDWPARIVNISGYGLGLFLGQHDAAAAKGQTGSVLLTLDHLRLKIPGRIAHAVRLDRGLSCGFGLLEVDYLRQKSYLQLIQPIAIGQSLRPVPPELIAQNEPQLIRQDFRDDADSLLTVWREISPGSPLHSFEFRMHDYFCKADAQNAVLKAYLRQATDSHKGKLSNPVFAHSSGLHDEIRKLLGLILPNLSAAVPEDLKSFLRKFAH